MHVTTFPEGRVGGGGGESKNVGFCPWVKVEGKGCSAVAELLAGLQNVLSSIPQISTCYFTSGSCCQRPCRQSCPRWPSGV